ncbi:hypothetical protein [Nocardioides insulae]|uniref:hypothetical protein n=1 Tax=Nocardioides insulae TaxID=394734 RepID=UPI00040459A8|nr:hypothetical protein [Nocardioides insulae]
MNAEPTSSARWPRFEAAGETRPVALIAPGAVQLDLAGPGEHSQHPLPQPAPSVAVVAEDVRPTQDALATLDLALVSGEVALAAGYDARRGTVWLTTTTPAGTKRHRSRRSGRLEQGRPVDGFALTLTGVHLTALTCTEGSWTARARVDLGPLLGRTTHDESWLADLQVAHAGAIGRLRAGGFGQLGLRDLRLVTEANGAPYHHEGLPVLSATSAGPGFFDTAHTSLWSLDPERLTLRHLSDLFFRRPDRAGVYGDHATHLVREDGRWLVATSTWGDFDASAPPGSLRVILARSDADLLSGRHVLDTAPLALPTDGLTSVGVWDPHLLRTSAGWLVGYLSARRFFSFHPVLAEGPDLGSLRLRAAATTRNATEGTTLAALDGHPVVLASDGRDGRRGQRAAYPVFDLDLRQLGTLDAPYPTNLPWPTLVPTGNGLVMVGFDGTRYAGRLPGYGTHGAVHFARETRPPD